MFPDLFCLYIPIFSTKIVFFEANPEIQVLNSETLLARVDTSLIYGELMS